MNPSRTKSISTVVALWLLAGFGFSSPLWAGAQMVAPENACGGNHETATWARWDGGGASFAWAVLEKRLVTNGDVYVLYDLQTLFHNMQAMAARCSS